MKKEKKFMAKTPKLYIKEKAELKIRLTMAYGGRFETSWFGIIKKFKNDFMLTNILVPPQENRPAFVTTKDDEFPKWFFDFVVKKGLSQHVRLHGHTHPTFAPTPSGTDVDQFKKLLEEVDDYFIQLILNNDLEFTCLLHVKGEKPIPIPIIFEYGKKMNKVLQKTINKQYISSKQLSLFETPDFDMDDYPYYKKVIKTKGKGKNKLYEERGGFNGLK
jgi:hypothetical protein